VFSGGRGGGGWRMEEDEYEEEERMRRELHAREQFLRQNGQESNLRIIF
jgi:hypothetical protein